MLNSSETFISVISAIIESKKEVKQQELPFAVEIDDNLGVYRAAFLINLKKEAISFNDNAVSNVVKGSVLTFSKQGVSIEKDVRKLLLNGVKVYSLINDYDEIIEEVKEYFTNRKEEVKKDIAKSACANCPLQGICKKAADILKKQEEPIKVYDEEYISTKELVQIFGNYVKVGYEVYPIRNFFGKKYIKAEDTIFEVKKDGFGGKSYIQEVIR